MTVRSRRDTARDFDKKNYFAILETTRTGVNFMKTLKTDNF